MSIRRTMARSKENKLLKLRRKELLSGLDMSKSKLQQMSPRVTKEGMNYGNVEFANARGYTDEKGKRVGHHKPSLKSQFSLLFDLTKQKMEDEVFLENLKKELEEKKEREKNEQV